MKKDISIQIIRIISMLMIIICHILNSMSNSFIIMMGQFFNIGVYIFLFVSGFLYGEKKIRNYREWYLNKIKKLMIPIWIFIVFLMICVFKKYNIFEIKYIFIYLLNIQGFFKGIIGAGHLWFLTPLMLCYLCLFFLNKIKNKKILIYICILILIIAISTSAILKIVSLYFFYILMFILGYVYKKYLLHVHIKNISLILVIIISFITRIVTNRFLDNTFIYEVICVPLTSIFIGISIFIFIYNISKNISKLKIIDFFDELSYYIYICHYMYIVGPLIVLKQENAKLYLPIIIMLSIVSAIVLKRIHLFFLRRILRK